MDSEFIAKSIREIREIMKKDFSTARKLTEGDNAFQSYAMENTNRVGESTPPINIVEPPVKIQKADISTMAPKEQIGENNADKEIKYDNPVDKLKKDYSGGVAFSTQHQIPGEMSNGIGPVEKIDAAVETKKRNMLTSNREPYFEKTLKKSINAWFINIDENTTVKDALFSLSKSFREWNKDAEIDVANQIFRNTAEIVKSYPMGSYAQRKAINSEIDKYF
jgi:hypothetical protein